MYNRIKIVLIIMGILLVVIGIFYSLQDKYNVYYDKYDDIGYKELNISDVKLRRYNEKLNNNNIAYLVGNLDTIYEGDKITDIGIIKYTMLFAETYDYRYEENIRNIDGNTYIDSEYLKEIIKELFNLDINLKSKNFKVNDGYIEFETPENLITDVFSLYLQKVLYNEKEDIYIAYIIFSSNEYDEDYDIQSKEASFIIRYKKCEDINTILQYVKISE